MDIFERGVESNDIVPGTTSDNDHLVLGGSVAWIIIELLEISGGDDNALTLYTR